MTQFLYFYFLRSEHQFFCAQMPFTQRRLPLAEYVLFIHTTPTSELSRTAEDGWQATIFISQVTRRQSAQADVGFVMWPSAIVLLRRLASDPHVPHGKSA